MSFRNLPIYIHIVNSASYEEFKLRMELFDMELLNPNKYPKLKETYEYLNDISVDEKEVLTNNEFDILDLESQLDVEKHKNECNNFYIMRLEDRLNIIFNQKDEELMELKNYINNLKNTADEYYRIKENYKILQKQNKELIQDNSELKKGVFYKIKKYF